MAAQPSVNVDVGVNVGVDAYAAVAPGDPVESVDVFYDQLSPYGVWVDEPGVGRVFVADQPDYVPYTRGHWEYTNLGFVWVSTEPFAWATSHYGRWAYSSYYGRWYWLPDTEWGPAWVQWREVGDDFGWAPLPPEIVVRTGWQPPVEVWHYCGAQHILDANLTRYYEPRERVIEIHRSARPIEHYATVSNVKVVVGPAPTVLRAHRVEVRPVKVEPRLVGRWTPGEARAQVERAREHRTTFEVQNQRRIESKPQIHTAQVKVIEAHPQIKAQINARVQGRPEPNDTNRGRTEPNARPETREPNRPPTEPARPESRTPNPPAQTTRPETRTPNRPANEPERTRSEPNRAEPNRAEPNRAEPNRAEPNRAEPQRPAPPRAEPQRPQPDRAEPNRAAPNHAEPQRAQPPRAEPQRPEPPSAEPQRPQPNRAEPQRAQPPRAEPQRAQPPRAEPQRPQPPRAEPQRPEPPSA
ncbi:MAG: hypothetical protein E6J90_47775, partial [Deltaproteobacteria bacterium]